MRKILLAGVVVALTSGVASVHADTVSYNQNVAGVGGGTTGDLYFGTGNPNGDFTTSTASTDEVLGLRADIRGGALVTPTDSSPGVTNLYTVPAGGSPDALWDFLYSIDVSGTTNSLADYTALLTVTAPGGGSASFNPLTVVDNDSPNNIGNTKIAQNAENIVFGGGDQNLLGQYTFDLTLSNGGVTVASDEILVDVVPVPLPSAAGMGLAMLGLVGVGAILRKKLRTA